MKLAVVGGGSTYTPELVDGFARLQAVLPVEELVLTDPAADRLALVGGLAQRMFARAGHSGAVRYTDSLVDAVDGADVVLIQLRVGGQAARLVDETLPLECGCVGQETTGWGGLAKALRTVPVVLDIAETVAKHAKPDAWIVDFTNPVGIVTRALLDAGHRAVGLCNVAIGFQRQFAALRGVAPDRVALDHVGLNHLTWVRGATVDGVEVLPQLIADHGEEIADRTGLPLSLTQRLGVVPSYYLRYFYAHDSVVAEQRREPSRAEKVAEIERTLLDLYADPTLDTKPDLLEQRGGAFYSEAAVQLVASLTADTGDVQVVNLRNAGTFSFLADDAVIEVPATISAAGPRPVTLAPLGPLQAGLVAHVSAYEELALDAAVRGGRERVFQALLAHPLIGQLDVAERLTDMLLEANSEHLRWLP
jgi:6-phospho-beta-glucosidase